MRHLLVVCALAACARARAPGPGLGGRVLDLTHPFNDKTLYWPTSPSGFVLTKLSRGPTPAGFFYAANSFAAPEHGGTHLDAPIHFAEGKASADAVPLARLIGPAVVVDISARAASDPDALATPADLEAFERQHGAIAPGTIVLIRTGWAARWPDRKRYFGDDKPGDATHLHFPGLSADAARVLVARQIAAVGIDTASIDHGPSTEFLAHRVLLGADIPAFENLAALDALPPRGATVIALPMKIEGGSGGPLRIVVVVP
ncbi:MAG TPA: cyclase family protein [Polyangia bacterium]|nr:cyclase family protein [Polyangia bacterium]